MKKSILALSLFVLLFLGFNTKTTSAETLPAGCLPGYKFSTTTGKPCVTQTTPIACAVGDKFDSNTGKPCLSFTPNNDKGLSSELKTGSRGAQVRLLQQFLKDEGYYTGRIDGSYGPGTMRAIKYFQEDNDLPITGKLDARTRAFINGTIVPIITSEITVVFPNGGEAFVTGTRQTIKWTAPSFVSNVMITLDKMYECNEIANLDCIALYSSRVLTIAEQAPNTGYFEWYIPTTLASGKYKIVIDSYDKGKTTSDISDNYFTISSDSQQTDAQIKANLSSLRVQAELIYDMDGGDYDAVCGANGTSQNSLVASVIQKINQLSGGTAVCGKPINGAASTWAISSPLKSGGHWCVDSTGSSKAISYAISATGTSCSQGVGTLSIDPTVVNVAVGSAVKVKAWYSPSCVSGVGCTKVLQEVTPVWTVTNTNIAEVRPSNYNMGICSSSASCPESYMEVVGKSLGNTTLTAIYTDVNGNIFTDTARIDTLMASN